MEISKFASARATRAIIREDEDDPMHTAPHNTVKVKGIQLKADRLAAGHSQESFAATCGSVSLATVRRAEQSHRIMQPSLKKMSDPLSTS